MRPSIPNPASHTRKIARAPTSRLTRFPYAGYISSKKYQGAPVSPQGRSEPSGNTMRFEESPGTHTRPPSPRTDSEINRSLSLPGIAVG